MNKTQAIKDVAEKTGLPRTQVRAVLEAFLSADPKKGLVAGCMKRGERLTLAGFGTFSVRERAARTARNPRTGEKTKVAKRRYPVFKASKNLRGVLKK